ncbi:hypothetical protein HanXRQr2_Chr11g0491741 [Helianthus annuus]|uniref:Uncharacterized protein n=1 Tax=Helianthus annuus TaxID=4232 RepID=A0A9K3HQ18_HELAN|nr:hypothetical protein HanXRQr2_Chr11g0491741 [Helianthus annuus]KAJ0875240.1 hypothetical protein HanPSC8_Chr11g0473871 [Helianthus annuus]
MAVTAGGYGSGGWRRWSVAVAGGSAGVRWRRVATVVDGVWLSAIYGGSGWLVEVVGGVGYGG